MEKVDLEGLVNGNRINDELDTWKRNHQAKRPAKQTLCGSPVMAGVLYLEVVWIMKKKKERETKRKKVVWIDACLER